MPAFILRSFIWLLLAFWLAHATCFLVLRSVPGGPYDANRRLPKPIKEDVARYYPVDIPIHEQYAYHLLDTVRGQWGPSYRQKDRPVGEMIAWWLPRTATTSTMALVLALLLGPATGFLSTLDRHRWIDGKFIALSAAAAALPAAVLAVLVTPACAGLWALFPGSVWTELPGVVLPALGLGVFFAPLAAWLSRQGMLDTIGRDYVRTAYAKGLKPWRIVRRHVMPDAMRPVVCRLYAIIAAVVTGSAVLEIALALPGLGGTLKAAADAADYTVLMGVILAYTMMLLTTIVLADVSYAMIDTRVKRG